MRSFGDKRLARIPCGASALAAAALRACVEVEQLLACQVAELLGSERLLAGLQLLHVDAEWLQRAARAGAREPDVDRARDDVQVLRVRQVDQEPQDQQQVRPEEEPREERLPSGAHPREQVRDGRRHRGPRRRVGVVPERDARSAEQEERQDDPRDQAEDPERVQTVGADESFRPLHQADPEGDRDPHEHQCGEHVLRQAEPSGVADPREREAGGRWPDRAPRGSW